MLKRGLLLSVLLFSVLSLAYSENADPETMTTAAILMELSANLNAREMELNQREFLLDAKETQLNEREQSLTAIENLSKSLREESRKMGSAEYWRGFGMGFAVGTAAGLSGGIPIGVRISK